MQTKQVIPNEVDIRAAYDQGVEAVILLFQKTFLELSERIQQVEDQLSKNSNNSGKPPSTQNPQIIRARYRSRFGIETSYRCMRQAHAMTTSRNPALRFFLLALAFLILNLWCVLRWRFCQIPRQGGRRINQKAYELQRHRQFLAHVIDQKYHPLYCILSIVAPLDQ